MSQKPFFVTIPHSGEKVPELTPWLMSLKEETLMRDVDRFVDLLYAPAIEKLDLVHVKTEWHRYAVDLNRIPQDIDCRSVESANLKSGHERGYHWVVTTFNEILMAKPMTQASHQKLTELIYEPFHASVKKAYLDLREKLKVHTVYHLDLHSMPSLGTKMHLDPGEKRADIVISDCDQQSCHAKFRDLVIAAYATSGFKVAYNWPYKGGRVSQIYGKPAEGQQAIQVELNRSLYMNEETKKLLNNTAEVQKKLSAALSYIESQLPI